VLPKALTDPNVCLNGEVDMFSRGEMRGLVLRFLNKTADFSGFYTPEKMNDAIQEAFDAVAVQMFMGSEGWLSKYIYLDTTGNQVSVDLPGNVAMIQNVRYLVGDIYVPLLYDPQIDDSSYIGSSVEQAWAGRYRLLGRQIVFDPPMANGGPRFLQIEATYYPSILLDDSQIIDPQFDRAMINYCKYKVCSILAGSIEKDFRAWQQEEQEWFGMMMQVINRRTLKSTAITEFA
jgi:hypothetical protein